MEIAGLVTRVQPLFFSTREYCRPYLTDQEPECFVEVTARDLVYEQEMAEKEAIEEGLRIRKFTDPFLERAAIQRKIAEALLNRDTLLFHGSTVGVDGAAYLFTAPCGTGKSTHTRLWLKNFPDAFILNDDKPALRLENGEWFAYGTPWSGKTDQNRNVRVRLGGICVLRRGARNQIAPYKGRAALHDILEQTARSRDPAQMANLLELLDQLLSRVPVWKMECNMEPEAAQVSYHAMSGKEV